MAAKIGEEIGVERNGLRRQHAFGGVEEFCLGLVARLFLRLEGIGRGKFNLLQALAVDLAGGEFRQAFDELEPCRNHIGRQALPQFVAQESRVDFGLQGGNHERNELFDFVIVAQDDGGLRNAGETGELCFDFAQFDAKAANLDLIVDPAMEHDFAVRGDLHRIAGPVQNRIGRVIQERIGDEFLAGQPVAAQIAFRHPGPADEKLAFDARREKVEALARHIASVIRNRPADRDLNARPHFRDRRDDRRLRRAIGIEDLAPRPAPAIGNRRRAGFAAKDDQPQGCDVARQKCQKGWHRVQHRHAICFQKTGKLVGLAHHLGGRHEKARAGKVRKPDFLHRQIEGDGSALENDIARLNPVDFVGGAQIMANIAPRYHDALGCPGRTGRVNEIGGVLRARAERPRVDFRRVGGVLGIGQKTGKSPSRAGCRKLRGESGGGQEAPGFGI